MRSEGAISRARKYAHGVSIAAQYHVRLAVCVEVRYSYRKREKIGRVVHLGLERAITITHEHSNATGNNSVIGDYQVLLTVLIKVSFGDCATTIRGRVHMR